MSEEEDDSIIIGGEDVSLVKFGLCLLHGWKASNKNLEEFAKRLVKMDPSLVVMLPNALDEESSPEQRSWFSFGANAEPGDPNGWRLGWPQVKKLLSSQTQFMEKYNLSSIVMGGFSQGAIAAAALPGSAIKRLNLSSAPLKSYSFSECLFIHGTQDSFFPIESMRNMVEELQEKAAATGRQFKHELLEHDGGHDLDHIDNDQIRQVCKFVTGRDPPLSGAEESVAREETQAEATPVEEPTPLEGGTPLKVTPGEEEAAPEQKVTPLEELAPPGPGWEMVPNQASKQTEEMIEALKAPVSSMFDDVGIQDWLWGSTDEEAKNTRNSWGRGNPFVGVFRGSDVVFATNLAKAYAIEGCTAKLPSHKYKSSDISKVIAHEEYNDLEIVHGVGAGTLLAVHLAAWRAAIGRPLKALVLEAPVGRLQEIPGMRGAFECENQDPLEQASKVRFMMEQQAEKDHEMHIFLIKGQDAVLSQQSFGTMRCLVNNAKLGAVATELERSLDEDDLLASEIVDILFES